MNTIGQYKKTIIKLREAGDHLFSAFISNHWEEMYPIQAKDQAVHIQLANPKSISS